MEGYKVHADIQHFQHINEILHDIQRLRSVFKNEGVEITQQEFIDFNGRYREVLTQLEAWYKNSLLKIKEN